MSRGELASLLWPPLATHSPVANTGLPSQTTHSFVCGPADSEHACSKLKIPDLTAAGKWRVAHLTPARLLRYELPRNTRLAHSIGYGEDQGYSPTKREGERGDIAAQPIFDVP